MYSRFEELLEKHGVTPYKVSKETGISQATLSDWKKGKTTPKQDKLQIIADYFNVPLSYLLGVEDKTYRENEFEAKNPLEKEVLLLCRKVNEAPPEDREKIVEQFKSSVDLYLRAKGKI